MRVLAFFLFLFIIYYITYFVMKHKLENTEKETEIIFKEVPDILIDHQYNFDTKGLMDSMTVDNNMWKTININ